MRSSVLSSAAAVLAAAQLTSAQTFTSCNPTTSSNCPSDPALGKTLTVDFTQGSNDFFNLADGTTLTYDGTNGANFSMAQQGQAPTITSKDYIFFGKVTVRMQAAPGVGIVSSFVMESDDLDEIDWEWLGGNTTSVESNYFGKGNTTTFDRALYHAVSAPQSGFHDYTVDWSKDSIVWSIDGTAVRTLNYADALGGANFPQTPMVIKLGNWDGGASTENEGTIEWAGGLTDWSQAPFNMYVQSVTIEDSNTGATSYTYGDETGSYQSIQISTDGNTTSTESSSSSSASGTATASSSGSVATSGSTISSSSSSSDSNSTSSGSELSTPSSSPPFLNPAPASNDTSSSNLTSSATSTGSSSTTKSSSSPSASSSILTTNTNAASSRYGSIDIAVIVLGVTVGYFLM